MATSTIVRTTAVGVFQDRDHAQAAVNELQNLGFREDEIGVAYRREATVEGGHEIEPGSYAAEGAAAGAAAGAGVGALWGLGIVAGVLPAIGPAFAGGALAAILSSAATGAAAAGLAGALIGLGIPEDEARFYEDEFRSGHFVVTVRAEHRYDEAAEVIRRHGGYDMANRVFLPTMEDAPRRRPR